MKKVYFIYVWMDSFGKLPLQPDDGFETEQKAKDYLDDLMATPNIYTGREFVILTAYLT